MINIPEFLKGNEQSLEEDEMYQAHQRYMKHFGNGVNTESYQFSSEQWVQLLNMCIEEDTPLHELLGEEDDDEDDDY